MMASDRNAAKPAPVARGSDPRTAAGTPLGGIAAGVLLAILLVACGGDDPTGPTDVQFGETAIVTAVNPVINDDNDDSQNIPQPGSAQADVSVTVVDGPSAVTDALGVGVLLPLEAGVRTLSLEKNAESGTVEVEIDERDLREVAVSVTENGAAVMANIQYAFGGEVVEVTPTTPLSEVNEALSRSDIIVFFRAGTYTGDLTFGGSDLIMFGEGPDGGQVTLNGNVLVDGSRNRMRGAHVTGDLSVPGSNFGMSFSRVDGTFQLDGSSANLLHNALCGEVQLGGSGAVLLGNAGLPPIPASERC